MKRWYDKEEDVLNIQLSQKEYWKSVETEGFVIDISEDGTIISIEIPHASKIFSGDVRKVLELTEP